MFSTHSPGNEESTSMAGYSRVQSSLRLAVRNAAIGQRVTGEVERQALVERNLAPGPLPLARDLLARGATQPQPFFALDRLDDLHIHADTLCVQHAIAIPPIFARLDDQEFSDPRVAIRPDFIGRTRPRQPTSLHNRNSVNRCPGRWITLSKRALRKPVGDRGPTIDAAQHLAELWSLLPDRSLHRVRAYQHRITCPP